MVTESPPKPGLIKTQLDNGITACNGGGWQASDASPTTHAVATNGEGANDDIAGKRRRIVEQVQTVLAENRGEYEWDYNDDKRFVEIKAEAGSLFGAPEWDDIIGEVLEEENRELKELLAKSIEAQGHDKPNKSPKDGKRAKGKASQRKGYG